MMKYNEKITYHKDGPFFIIKFNSPSTLNSMSGDDYVYMGELLELAEKDNDIYFTVFQSTGRFFSSGADFKSIAIAEQMENSRGGKKQQDDVSKHHDELQKWLAHFASRNVNVTNAFNNHPKILVCCLNGPVIGFSAAICCLCDLVYAMNDQVYMLFPFANLGLVTEGGVASTLPRLVGSRDSYESLLFARPVDYTQMSRAGIINKNYSLTDTEEFNKQVLNELKQKINGLHLPSCLGIKKLMKLEWEDRIERINSLEVNDGVKYWVKGEPQKRFRQIGSKQRKHKL
ncbi:3,2-trans-enoyl-CoA isomerase [Nakaseomyces bracarensis]|uniref:3,2-trans-enoyl-CoA isomerase n=1 Tax=Nakaseomyces bracarensis TaxID=273131 RepID=A0ABR4NZ52_9SACH